MNSFYERIIAAFIRSRMEYVGRDELTRVAREQHEETARAVADALADANPRFDKEQFLDACGVWP